MITNHTLYDWQSTGETLSLEVAFEKNAIRLSESSTYKRGERAVWVELENGALRVHCEDGVHDEPVNIKIYEREIQLGADN